MPTVAELALAPPSPSRFTALCAALDALDGEELEAAMADARPALAWPAHERAIDAKCPWLAGVFDGRADRRLALAGRVSIAHQYSYRPDECTVRERDVAPLLLAFARAIDPSFDAPDAVIEQGDDIVYANGCGGGRRWEKRGDASRGVAFDDLATEHSADMENEGAWVVYGLADGCSLEVRRRDYFGGTYELYASGPAAPTLEAAALWGALCRGALDGPALERARDALTAAARARATRP